MAGGAIGGFSRTVLMNTIFGSPFKMESIKKDEETYNVNNALYRSGGIASLITQKGMGITLGKNIYTHGKNMKTILHENMHIRQQENITITYTNWEFIETKDSYSGGWAQFYGDVLPYYLNYDRIKTGFYSYYGYNNPLSLWNY